MGKKPLARRVFQPLLDTVPELPISSFASLRGFVIRCPSRTTFRLFLGSSAVEHSTVNRMVAGSNPARGAKEIKELDGFSDGAVRAFFIRDHVRGHFKK